MEVSVVTITLLIGILLLIILYFNRTTFKNLPPSPKGFILLGNINLFSKPLLYKDLAKPWKKIYPNYVTLWLLRRPLVILNDYKKTVDLFVNKFPLYSSGRPQTSFFHEITEGGKDIFFANADSQWNFQRKLIHSALRKFAQNTELDRHTKSAFKQFKELLIDNCEKNDKRGIFPYEECYYLAYNITGAIVFGKVFKYNDSEFVSLRQNLEKLNKYFIEDLSILMIPFIHKFPIPILKKVRMTIKLVLDYVTMHIEEHKLSGQFYECPKDIIDFILKEKEEMNTDQSLNAFSLDVAHIRQIVFNIFSAGTDTTALTVCWMMGILATNKNVAQKVRDEVIELEMKENREISVSDKQKMPYTQAVLYEIFRYTTIVPLGLLHEMMEDGSIDQYNLPKGTQIMYNQYGFHFDSTYWTEPDKFNPDRFLENGILMPKMNNLLPFGCGRRVCLGESVAKSDLFLLLALICKEIDITWCPDNKYDEIKENTKNTIFRYPGEYYVTVKECT